MATETPTYPQYTSLPLETGLFDQLMATVKYHLEIEFKQQRITGAEYSKVYLGSLEAIMTNTTQYLLGTMLIEEMREKYRLEAIKLKIEAEVLELQKEKLRFEIDFLYPAQLIKLQQEGELITAQVAKIDKEIEYLTAKIASEIANVDGTGVTEDSVIGRQVSLLRAQKLGFAGDIENKVAKLYADYDALYQSVHELPAGATLSDATQPYVVDVLDTAAEIKEETYTPPVNPGAPDAPTTLAATADGSYAIDLTWVDASTDETGFTIQRSLAGSGSWGFVFTTVADATGYKDEGLLSNTAYDYRIQSVNASGGSAWSNTASATTVDGSPAAPSVLNATSGGITQINLSWQDNSNNETSFELERSLANTGGWAWINSPIPDSYGASDSNVVADTAYDYRIRAMVGTTASAWSNVATATTDDEIPTAPTNLILVEAQPTYVYLDFDPGSQNADNIEVERGPVGGPYVLHETINGNANVYISYVDIVPGVYEYRMKAVNSFGDSPYSNILEVTIPA